MNTMYWNRDQTFFVNAYEQDGKYCLQLGTLKNVRCRKWHGKQYKYITKPRYIHSYKTFDTPEQANKYFKAIRKRHPDLKKTVT